MPNEDAEVPATVVLQHLRRFAYRGGITILHQSSPACGSRGRHGLASPEARSSCPRRIFPAMTLVATAS
jgi:hypothetical protein